MSELFTIGWMVRTVSGEIVGTPPYESVQACTIDSRSCEPGALFFALPGTRTDGHRFVDEALQRGAAAAVVSTDYPDLDRLAASVREGAPGALVLVKEPLRALQALASAYLTRFPDLVRIGVTGSNGKTTTKELIAGALSGAGRTYRSEGNLNSEIGLPLAIFGVTEEHRYAVFELAMSWPGEIRNLAGISRPQHACITNIGTAHIGHIGSVRGIAEEKRSIFSHFDGGQTAYVHESEPWREMLLEDVPGKRVLFGPEAMGDMEIVRSEGLRGTRMRLGKEEFLLQLPGAHNAANAYCAVAVARELGVADSAIAEGLEQTESLFGRSEFIDGDVAVYQDCYNANPESVRALLELFRSTPWQGGRRLLVLGAMKELGNQTEEAHRRVARDALAAEADRVILVGEEFANVLNGSREAVHCYGDVNELAAELPALVDQGDLVVLKGSRSSGLERLVPHLQEPHLQQPHLEQGKR